MGEQICGLLLIGSYFQWTPLGAKKIVSKNQPKRYPHRKAHSAAKSWNNEKSESTKVTTKRLCENSFIRFFWCNSRQEKKLLEGAEFGITGSRCLNVLVWFWGSTTSLLPCCVLTLDIHAHSSPLPTNPCRLLMNVTGRIPGWPSWSRSSSPSASPSPSWWWAQPWSTPVSLPCWYGSLLRVS